jgi:hypothetical protein
MKSARWLLFLGLLAIVRGVGAQSISTSAPPAPRTLEPAFELRNLGTLRNLLVQYHDCTGGYGCYADDLRAQTDRAQAALAERVRARKPSERLAIVFDIDETVLSNWKELMKLNLGF